MIMLTVTVTAPGPRQPGATGPTRLSESRASSRRPGPSDPDSETGWGGCHRPAGDSELSR